MDYVIVFLLGVAVTIAPAVVYAASAGRRADGRAHDDDRDLYRRWQVEKYGPNPQPFPYQPPVIVLAAPREQQPQTVNNTYNDNRSVTIHTGAQGGQGMPLIADRQMEIQAQQGGRVFRVVGEREEWND
jgi:hypothetical protein